MTKIDGRAILFLFLATLTTSIKLILNDGNDLVFNSSMRRQTISVSLSSHGQLNSSFSVQSEILSPLMNRFQFTHGSAKMITKPELKDQQINFNDFDGKQYWFAIKNKIKFNDKKEVNFVGLKIYDGDKASSYLLPAFSQPFSFLPIDSLYNCGQVLISITINSYGVDMALMAKSGKTSWRNPDGEWGWNWSKKQEDSFDIGRYTRKDTQAPIVIELKNGQSCRFNPAEMPKSTQLKLEKPGYLSLKEVLALSTPLPKANPQL